MCSFSFLGTRRPGSFPGRKSGSMPGRWAAEADSLGQAADPLNLDDSARYAARGPHDVDQTREPGVAGKALFISRVNLLDDNSDLVEAVGVKENRMAHIAPAPGRITLDQLFARQVTRQRRHAKRVPAPFLRIIGIDPVTERAAEVHQGIAQRRHFPV